MEISDKSKSFAYFLTKYIKNASRLSKKCIKQDLDLPFKMMLNWIKVSELFFPWFNKKCQETRFLQNFFKTVKYGK